MTQQETKLSRPPVDMTKRIAFVKSVLNGVVGEAYVYQRDFVTYDGEVHEWCADYTMDLISKLTAISLDLRSADPQAFGVIDAEGNPSPTGEFVGVPAQIADVIFDLFWLCRRLGVDVGTVMMAWLTQAHVMSESIRKEAALSSQVTEESGEDDEGAEATEI